MKILFIGDIFGKPGRKILKKNINEIKKQYQVDIILANAENSAHGKGITQKIYDELISAGIDLITLGNHTWSKEGIVEILENNKNILRPYNIKKSCKYYDVGVGTNIIEYKKTKIRVTSIIGNTVFFNNQQSNSFKELEKLLINKKEKDDIHIIDLHAETTSEKNAFLWYFNGKVSAILGTHTHVQTNDGVITHENTAYISDIGMTGPSHGIIGGEKTRIIKKFLNPEEKFILEVEKGPSQLNAVLLTFDTEHNPINIETINIKEGFKKTLTKNCI